MNAYELGIIQATLESQGNLIKQQADRIAELEKDKKELHVIAQRMAMAESDARKSLQSIKDAQTKPLSDEEIINCYAPTKYYSIEEKGLIDFARAIEERHGIK